MKFRTRRRAYLFALNKLRLPRGFTTTAIKTLGFITDPAPFWVRRSRARKLAAARSMPIGIESRLGYRLFGTGEFHDTQQLIVDCRTAFAASQASGVLHDNLERNAKSFLVPVLADRRDLMKIDSVRQFVLSPSVTAAVSDYFGTVPILSTVDLLWTSPNNSLEKSQKYHFDTEDRRQLKLFLNIFDVDEDCGPLTLVPADASADIRRQSGYAGGRRTRLADEAVEQVAPQASIPVIGPAGSGVFLDTSRCLHFGSRSNRRERLVLMAQYIGYYAPKLSPTDWQKGFGAALPAINQEQRLLLRCPAVPEGVA